MNWLEADLSLFYAIQGIKSQFFHSCEKLIKNMLLVIISNNATEISNIQIIMSENDKLQ